MAMENFILILCFIKKKEIFIPVLRKSYYDGTLENYVTLVKRNLHPTNLQFVPKDM